MIGRKGIEFSFGWIFALIAGAAILAMAIYATTNFIDIAGKGESSARSVELSSVLMQLQTGVEEKGASAVDATTETMISNDCKASGSTASEKAFGTQSIRTATASKIGKSFKDNGIPLRSGSIYLFSNKTMVSDSFIVLTQTFSLPFKIADVAIMWPAGDKYCFVNPPQDVKDRTAALNIPGLNFTDSVSGCPASSKRICFSSGNCDATVSAQSNTVSKNGEIYHYDDESSALFYAAIFSDKSIYECQVKRLMSRGAVLASIYSEKAALGSAYGCSAGSLIGALTTLEASMNSTASSLELGQAMQAAEMAEVANDALACKQF